MNNKQLQKLLKQEVSRREFLKFNALAIAAIFGVSAVLREVLSHAATFAADQEAENGVTTTNAKTVTDSGASDGKAVRFTSPTTTPPPSRDDLILGSYKPSASTTGYLPGTSFTTTIANNITYSTTGQTITNTMFNGKVTVTGKNITFRNCWFRGSDTIMLMCNNDTVDNLLVEDCTFKPQSSSINSNGIFGRRYTAKRCNISGTVDAFSIIGSNTAVIDVAVNILGCYAHDLAYYSPDPGHPTDNQTHNDVIQYHFGGSNVLIRGNNLQSFYDPAIGDASKPSVDQTDSNGIKKHISGNLVYPSMCATSCLMLAPVAVNITNLTIDKNYMDGGACLMNMPERTTMTGVVVSNNRWGRKMHLGDTFTVLANAAQPITITGNVYEDNGAAYDGRRRG